MSAQEGVPAWVLFLPNDEQDYVLGLKAEIEQLQEKWGDALYRCRRCVDALRNAGCKCDQPLLGHRPGKGPRCRLCNVEAHAALDAALARIEEQKQSIKTIVKEDGVVVSRQREEIKRLRGALAEIDKDAAMLGAIIQMESPQGSLVGSILKRARAVLEEKP